ncbi:MarR family winged helix-turn-helix transcriptional regulator [Arthrobacter sulfonylureivorans]|uniref:MarR family transcriptional regulator n=1 Tax=Arthrobacter sulfonylureivorans TaxID=2486855 RepID=A0ABY3WDJ4_9MICC|nr:MarR family transcriptional regulator [Arthrobacter sulfonylureivorans]UNK47283.1 MarR family transcriptional regulator [Arthrobacter sulfonylureivorans]
MPDLKNWPMPRLLSTAARLVEHEWNDKLAGLGLTHAGVIALEVLAADGEMTQAQLANRVRVQAQTMGKTLGRLEVHGHIVRARSEVDRRRQIVQISDEGQLALKQAAELERLLSSGNGDQMDELKERLTVIIRRLGNTRFGIAAGEPIDIVELESFEDGD